jgi:lysyl endopeptidase
MLKTTTTDAQVISRILGSEETMDMFIPFPVDEEPVMYLQKAIDVEKVLEEDRVQNRQIPRFAVAQDVFYTQDDGLWTDYGDFDVWKIGINAPKAASLSVMFEEFTLPEDTEMYIYSVESRMIQGPILAKDITDNTFVSDVIERAAKIQIAVICPDRSKDKFRLNITKVAQGVARISERAWGGSSPCHYDVNCTEGAGWELQRDAVGLVIAGMTGVCSGTLMNNPCNDFTPYFLTALHCITGSTTPVFSWSFRFGYQSSNPNCPGPTSGSEEDYAQPSKWVTRSGVNSTATVTGTDAALLTISGGALTGERIAFAGWDRSTTTPSNGFSIHHPWGDTKKISIENNTFTSGSWGGLAGTTFWNVNFDLGIVEPGCSGGPLFNGNGLVVGQLAGSDVNMCELPGQCFCDQVPIGEYGKLDVSWPLFSSILNSAPPSLTSLNGLRTPFINHLGDNYVCSTNTPNGGSIGTFQLLNTNGEILVNEPCQGNRHRSQIEYIPPGIYYVRMLFPERSFVEKVVIAK